MKIKKISNISELKQSIEIDKKIYVIDICDSHCFISCSKESALFFTYDKSMFDYVKLNLIDSSNFKTFVFDPYYYFGANSYYLKSWFYVNGYNSLDFSDNLYGNLEEFVLKDRAKICSIFFNNYNDEVKNYSFSLINLCVPVYRNMTKVGLFVKKFEHDYYDKIKKYIDVDDIFHPPYGLVTSKSSRVASILHSFPKSMKHNIVARQGNKIVEMDYNAAEARVIAYLSDDKNLKKSLKEDIHVYNAKLIFGDDIEIEEKHRELAKTIFFGWINGLNMNTISKSVDLDFNDTRILINKLKKNYSKIVSWANKLKKDAISQRMITNKFGRVRNFSSEIIQNSSKASRQIFSFIIQSTFTDIKLAVMLSLHKHFPDNIVGEITDSIILEFKDDSNLDKNVNKAKKILEKPFDNQKLVIPVKITIGDHLKEQK